MHTLTLICAPYVLYGVKYIDLVSLGIQASPATQTLIRAPYVLYGLNVETLLPSWLTPVCGWPLPLIRRGFITVFAERDGQSVI